MDEVLELLNDSSDELFEPLGLGRESVLRVFSILYVVVLLGGFFSYIIFSTLSYVVVYKLFPSQLLEPYDREVQPGQIWEEIKVSLKAMPLIALLTVPIYIAEWAGKTKVYRGIEPYGWGYFFFSIALFLAFTDCGIYWIHRTLHIGAFYKYLHKVHHNFLSPSPFAAVAFHPIDGWLQSVPYHLFVLLFPLNNRLYLGLFMFVQLWTISIHDRVSFAPLDGIINGSAHHACHHDAFNYNYGQYFTFWDRLFHTHRVWDGGLPKRALERRCAAEREAGGAQHKAKARIETLRGRAKTSECKQYKRG